MIDSLRVAAVLVTAAATIGMSGQVIAQEEELNDLGAINCRDILLAAGEDRDAVILVLHAYLLGEAKQLTYDPDELAEATDTFLDACIDKPDSKALATMRAQFK